MEKVIITVATTGSRPTREENPNLPITAEEIANAAYECYNEGASIVHVHVRDPKTGKRSMAFEHYADAYERIRAKCNIIINLSTGAGGQLIIGPDNQPRMDQSFMATPEKRVEHVLKLKPEMCSLDVGSANQRDGVFVNAEVVVDKMAELMKAAGVKPELEVFDVGHIQIAARLINLGLVEKNAHFQLCMGTRMGVAGTPKNALHMAESLPPGVTWSIFGVAATQIPMAGIGVLLGGHVRVGFEDNLYMKRGQLAKSNAELVKRAADIARHLNRDVATVEEARKILGLAPR
ncbi:MAG TPA: 3-keto-5-aminohexanoate cleavage protein [Thermodesulfobacteriota bacterium]|nr:3-keto-5-aminohexanoate cleavage protein [Thermodesulfobacteriota bacterium]